MSTDDFSESQVAAIIEKFITDDREFDLNFSTTDTGKVGSFTTAGPSKIPNPKTRIEQLPITDPTLELLDPTPDLIKLYRQLDELFFEALLSRTNLELKWTKRLDGCAGVFIVQNRYGGWNSWNFSNSSSLDRCARIELSERILRLRSRLDLVETLLHEMIHAYIYFKGLGWCWSGPDVALSWNPNSVLLDRGHWRAW